MMEKEKMKPNKMVSFESFSEIFNSLTGVGVVIVSASDYTIKFFNNAIRENAPDIEIGKKFVDIFKESKNLFDDLGTNSLLRDRYCPQKMNFLVERIISRITWSNEPAFFIRFVAIQNDNIETKDSIRLFDDKLISYVIDEDFHIKSYDKKTKELYPHVKVGSLCHKALLNNDKPCPTCPIYNHHEENNGFPIKSFEFSIDSKKHHLIILRNSSSNSNSADKDISSLLDRDCNRDYLTGGYNRDGFITAIDSLRKSNYDITRFSIVYFNIKGFKAVNEIYSSIGGDNLLRVVFNRIITSKLKPLIGARKQSDQFAFLVEKSIVDYSLFNNFLKFKWNYLGHEVTIHMNSGIYEIDDSTLDISQMIDRAKLACANISLDAENQYAIYEKSMYDKYVDNALILSEFEQALSDGEFEVYYQPIVDTKTGKVASAEALIRWNSKEKGFISPADFVPFLEKNGYITALDSFVMDKVIEFVSSRKKENKKIVPISINLSRMDFVDEKNIERFLTKLNSCDIDPDIIRFELTESVYATFEEKIHTFTKRLNLLNSKILLDDFGSGFSSFSMVEKFSFDILKIDMGIIRKISQNDKARIIIETIIQMCHKLNIKVVAEGVENKEERDFLHKKKCDYIQGYFFSKPLPEKLFIEYLDKE